MRFIQWRVQSPPPPPPVHGSTHNMLEIASFEAFDVSGVFKKVAVPAVVCIHFSKKSPRLSIPGLATVIRIHNVMEWSSGLAPHKSGCFYYIGLCRE